MSYLEFFSAQRYTIMNTSTRALLSAIELNCQHSGGSRREILVGKEVIVAQKIICMLPHKPIYNGPIKVAARSKA
jgi:hypothetical protein